MSRQKKGEHGEPLLVERTPKQLAKMVGADTPVRVSRVCLQEIAAERARQSVAEETKPKRRRR